MSPSLSAGGGRHNQPQLSAPPDNIVAGNSDVSQRPPVEMLAGRRRKFVELAESNCYTLIIRWDVNMELGLRE